MPNSDSFLKKYSEQQAQKHIKAESHSNMVVSRVGAFLANNRLFTYEGQTDTKNTPTVGLASYNFKSSLDNISDASLLSLVKDCGVPACHQATAIEALSNILAQAKAAGGNNDLMRFRHFDGRPVDVEMSKYINNAAQIFPASLSAEYSFTSMPSNESFGAEVDKILPDIQNAMAVTILQFHRGILDRTIHRRPTTLPYVTYTFDYAEVYDLQKSFDDNSEERNYGQHRIPMIDLYKDPSSVSNILRPIKVLKQNDTDDKYILQDGVIKINTPVNLFDMARVANSIGNSNTNYTDLVSEGPILDSVFITLSSGTGDAAVTETFQVNTSQWADSRFWMHANCNDSADRVANVMRFILFTKDTKTVDGTASAILTAACSDTDVLRVRVAAAASINLKTADASVLGAVSASAHNINKAVTGATINTAVAAMTIAMVGASIDARYSEENLKKSNLALRVQSYTRDYAITNGRNVMVDFSMNQPTPDGVMPSAMEAISLGADHRALDITTKVMRHVYDESRIEQADPSFRRQTERLITQFPCGQRVKPTVQITAMDLSDINSIRDSDMLGDIRGRVERQMLNLFSLLFQNSMMRQQLDPSEKPHFKVITSSVILDNIFHIPHIHNHLNTEEPVDGNNVEFRYVLSNGVKCDLVTTNFDYMRNRIMCIPYREGKPDDTLNFGHNWDAGTFIAAYNPQADSGVWKRIFANSRTMIIPTNPSGIIIEVRNITEFVDLYETAALSASLVD